MSEDSLVADHAEAAKIMDRFARDCLQKPGQHVLVQGYTGSGKTTTLFWLFEALTLFGRDCLVWFDSNKSEESLTLLTMGPCRFLIPKGKTLDIKFNPDYKGPKLHEYEIVEMRDHMNPWADLKKDKINVICLSAYLVDPSYYAQVMGQVFTNLIYLAQRRRLIIPMTLFVDEIHNIAPANQHSFDHVHTKAGKIMQHNVERLRSTGVRLIGSTQGNSKLRKGVRTCFNWQIMKRGSNFDPKDEYTLSKFNPKWAKLKDRQISICFPGRQFSKLITIEYHPLGAWNEIHPDGIGIMDFGIELLSKDDETKEGEASVCSTT